MNIFILDENPYNAASYLFPKLVVKMPIESCQMLAAAYSPLNLNWGTLPTKSGAPYKITHPNHPCTLWLLESYANIAWLIEHTRELIKIYGSIYGRTHACDSAIRAAKEKFTLKTGLHPVKEWVNHTKFVVAAPQKFKEMDDPIEAYRAYMQTKAYINWDKYPQLTRPEWWNKV